MSKPSLGGYFAFYFSIIFIIETYEASREGRGGRKNQAIQIQSVSGMLTSGYHTAGPSRHLVKGQVVFSLPQRGCARGVLSTQHHFFTERAKPALLLWYVKALRLYHSRGGDMSVLSSYCSWSRLPCIIPPWWCASLMFRHTFKLATLLPHPIPCLHPLSL